MSKPFSYLIAVLLTVAVIMTALGGTLDITEKNGITISKAHAWNDGIFLVVFAIALIVFWRS